MNELQTRIINALYELNIVNTVSNKEQIKRAYYKMCKIYHPDQIDYKKASDFQNKNKYLEIQSAYEFLESNSLKDIQESIMAKMEEMKYISMKKVPIKNKNEVISSSNINVMKRESKIFSTNKEAARLQARHNSFEIDKMKAEKRWQYPKNELKTNNIEKQEKQNENELLKKIETIWLAEIIHRQIQLDKKVKDRDNIQKLYQAFQLREQSMKEK